MSPTTAYFYSYKTELLANLSLEGINEDSRTKFLCVT